MLLDIFDPKAPPQAIGIDLGPTNSIVAHFGLVPDPMETGGSTSTSWLRP